jgi:hypothetical protein
MVQPHLNRFTGNERELTDRRYSEALGVEERIIKTTKPNPCAGAPQIGQEVLAGQVRGSDVDDATHRLQGTNVGGGAY